MFEKNRNVLITTLVGKTCKITGNISTKESIRVDGYVKGNLETEGIACISESASLDGDIIANEVFVSGKVNGNIKAFKAMELEKSAVVSGDILTAKLHIHSGAIYNGKAVMGDNVQNVKKEQIPSE
ncbi:MAG: polymer-forming cytoskeletal protein [Candidatus Cloacimonetes bacterium]|jgi:cytoskeletal protein CcmA (bactofilin family)|nr:polymer-forming cytoskeletal protein [Candidatus Cloacimonadota bacterium]MDD4155135.1 polymer-forming cytoskeletal protein [Candidatus Cloacimonadota bacterium]